MALGAAHDPNPVILNERILLVSGYFPTTSDPLPHRTHWGAGKLTYMLRGVSFHRQCQHLRLRLIRCVMRALCLAHVAIVRLEIIALTPLTYLSCSATIMAC